MDNKSILITSLDSSKTNKMKNKLNNKNKNKNKYRNGNRRANTIVALSDEQVLKGGKSSKKVPKRDGHPESALVRNVRREFPYHPCTFNYARACFDPFHKLLLTSLPCIPDLNNRPTSKLVFLNRGTFFTGGSNSAKNTGFVSVSPFSYVSDVNNFYYSTSAFTGSSFLTSGLGVSYSGWSNSPFTNSQTSGLLGRPVAVGLRVRYSDIELNRGGSVTSVVYNQGYMSVTGTYNGPSIVGMTTANVLTDLNAYSKPADRNWHTCVWSAGLPAAMQFVSGTAGLAQCLGILVTGPGTTSVSYDYECIGYYEVESSPNSGPLTGVPGSSPSDTDLAGISAITDFMGKTDYWDFGEKTFNKAINYMIDTATHTAKSFVVGLGSSLLLA